MPRPCLICSCSNKAAKAAELISQGLSDQAVANALNAVSPDQPPMSLMAVSRHRRAHILKPAQDRLALLAKDSAARRERQELAAAAASDTPSTQALIEATLGLRAQMAKLTSIEQRLERMAALAEGAGSSGGVAQLAAQQFRGIETGAKLAGIGGFAPASQTAGQPGERRPVFSITMVFPSSGRTEEINVMEHPRPIEQDIDAHADASVLDSTTVTDD